MVTASGNWNSNNSVAYTLVSMHPFAHIDDARARLKSWPLRLVASELKKAFAELDILEDPSVLTGSEQKYFLCSAAAYETEGLSDETLMRLGETRWKSVLEGLASRESLPVDVMVQITLAGLANLTEYDTYGDFRGALENPNLPLWVMNVALNLHVHQNGPEGHFSAKVVEKLLGNSSLPLEVRARLTNPAWMVTTSGLHEWVDEKGKLKESYQEQVEAKYPELLDLPVLFIAGVLAELPVTDPEWCEVPDRWAEKVAKFATLPTGVSPTVRPNW